MRDLVAHLIGKGLRLIGIRTINGQFLFSYTLIFLFALASAVSLYMSLTTEASAINLAGRQRMLSQKVAKEALLVPQGVEEPEHVRATMALFEESHRRLLDGDPDKGIPKPSAEVRAQLQAAEALWRDYRAVVEAYLKVPDPKELHKLHDLSDPLIDALNKSVATMEAEANASVRNQQLRAMLMTAGILILVVLGRIYGLKHLMEQVALLKERLKAVGAGDFSQPLEVEFTDNEMGEAFTAYNQMLAEIGKLVAGVNRLAAEVNEGSSRVAASLQATDAGVREQQLELDQVATAMNEMVATVQEVARSAASAAEAGERASSEAEAGLHVATDAMENIDAAAEGAEEAADAMARLENDSKEVSQVLEVIKAIAEQTNLLALNAAIEAARAGEQGRGFAVVADEVRTLAQRTQQSTENIRQIIVRLQTQARDAATAMAKSKGQVRKGVRATGEAGSAFDGVVRAVATIKDMNHQIASAAEEQSHVAADVDRSVTQIAGVAEQTAHVANETVEAMAAIRRNMEELLAMTARLHTRA